MKKTLTVMVVLSFIVTLGSAVIPLEEDTQQTDSVAPAPGPNDTEDDLTCEELREEMAASMQQAMNADERQQIRERYVSLLEDCEREDNTIDDEPVPDEAIDGRIIALKAQIEAKQRLMQRIENEIEQLRERLAELQSNESDGSDPVAPAPMEEDQADENRIPDDARQLPVGEQPDEPTQLDRPADRERADEAARQDETAESDDSVAPAPEDDGSVEQESGSGQSSQESQTRPEPARQRGGFFGFLGSLFG